MLLVVAISFATPVGFTSVEYGFNLSAYQRLLDGGWDGTYIRLLRRTIRFAVTGTALTVLAGFPVAYWMVRYAGRVKYIALALLILPFWTSFLIRTFSLLRIIAGDGPLGALELNQDGRSVFIGITYNYFPLATLPMYAALERMDWSLVTAARDLGAGRWSAFRHVTLPMVSSGILTAALLVFVPMTGEFIVPQIMGSGTQALYASILGRQFLGGADWPFGAAMAVFLSTLLSGVVVALLLLARREEATDA